MISFLTEIAFWSLVILLCVGASYALLVAVRWFGVRGARLLEGGATAPRQAERQD